MRVREGTVLGFLTENDATAVAEVSVGMTLELGPMRGVALWSEEKGAEILFFLSPSPCPVVVMRGGVRQAGAFLLGPDGEIVLRSDPGRKETRYCFRARPFVHVLAGNGELCAFCRAKPGEHGVYCNKTAPIRFLRDKLLCRSCADAWERSA